LKLLLVLLDPESLHLLMPLSRLPFRPGSLALLKEPLPLDLTLVQSFLLQSLLLQSLLETSLFGCRELPEFSSVAFLLGLQVQRLQGVFLLKGKALIQRFSHGRAWGSNAQGGCDGQANTFEIKTHTSDLSKWLRIHVGW
jgi:hypothetical protein